MSTLPDSSGSNCLGTVIAVANGNQAENAPAHHRINVGSWIWVADVSTVPKLLNLFDIASIPGLCTASNSRIGDKTLTGVPDSIRNSFSVAFGHEEKEPYALVIIVNDARNGVNEFPGNLS